MGTPRPEPVAIHDHAMDNLRYIRRDHRAGGVVHGGAGHRRHADGVDGAGGGVAGVTAGARRRWLAVWIGEALVALLIGIVGAELKSRRAKLPLLIRARRANSSPGSLPAMLAGALLTGVLFQAGSVALLPGTWMLFTGPEWFRAGGLRCGWCPLMGACFMATGAAALLWPGVAGDTLLAAGFGGLHIIFGTVIAVKYGG